MTSEEDIVVFIPCLVLVCGIGVRHFSSVERSNIKWPILMVFLK